MSNRLRNYATILYPESAKDNWLQILTDLHMKILISPLHDKDCNKDGEIKKEHYHIVYIFDGKKSEKQVEVLNESIGAVGIEKINSLKGYARYLCHLDNKDKFQYNTKDIIVLGNIVYEEMIKEQADKYSVAKEILNYCRDNRIICYCDIVDFSLADNMEWFIQLVDNPHVYINYLKSLNFKLEKTK